MPCPSLGHQTNETIDPMKLGFFQEFHVGRRKGINKCLAQPARGRDRFWEEICNLSEDLKGMTGTKAITGSEGPQLDLDPSAVRNSSLYLHICLLLEAHMGLRSH